MGIGIKENIAKLEKEYGFGCKNSFDLRDLAGNVVGLMNWLLSLIC